MDRRLCVGARRRRLSPPKPRSSERSERGARVGARVRASDRAIGVHRRACGVGPVAVGSAGRGTPRARTGRGRSALRPVRGGRRRPVCDGPGLSDRRMQRGDLRPRARHVHVRGAARPLARRCAVRVRRRGVSLVLAVGGWSRPRAAEPGAGGRLRPVARRGGRRAVRACPVQTARALHPALRHRRAVGAGPRKLRDSLRPGRCLSAADAVRDRGGRSGAGLPAGRGRRGTAAVGTGIRGVRSLRARRGDPGRRVPPITRRSRCIVVGAPSGRGLAPSDAGDGRDGRLAERFGDVLVGRGVRPVGWGRLPFEGPARLGTCRRRTKASTSPEDGASGRRMPPRCTIPPDLLRPARPCRRPTMRVGPGPGPRGRPPRCRSPRGGSWGGT